jgi:hypothetical protein
MHPCSARHDVVQLLHAVSQRSTISQPRNCILLDASQSTCSATTRLKQCSAQLHGPVLRLWGWLQALLLMLPLDQAGPLHCTEQHTLAMQRW